MDVNFSFETLETPALTKAQLAELLFQHIGLNKRESKDMIDAFFDLIVSQLVKGEDVKISGPTFLSLLSWRTLSLPFLPSATSPLVR